MHHHTRRIVRRFVYANPNSFKLQLFWKAQEYVVEAAAIQDVRHRFDCTGTKCIASCEEHAVQRCFAQLPLKAKYKKQEQPWLIFGPKGFDSDDGETFHASALYC